MREFIGKRIICESDNRRYTGILTEYNDKDNTILITKNDKSYEVALSTIRNMEMVCDENNENGTSKSSLDEKEMYELFYDAFNTYGPLEDQFIYQAALTMCKLIKANKNVRIIIGSDDVFGRIGLCLAKILLKKPEHTVTVETHCLIKSIKSQQYLNIFKNNDGEIIPGCEIAQIGTENNLNDVAVFACNRNFDFSNVVISPENMAVYLDIPFKKHHKKALQVGLGFTPNTAELYKGMFYLFDMGYSEELCRIHGINEDITSSIKRKTK